MTQMRHGLTQISFNYNSTALMKILSVRAAGAVKFFKSVFQ